MSNEASEAPKPVKKVKPPLHLDIELDFEATVDGVKVGKLTMNRPTVQMRMDAEAYTGSELTIECIMIGNLCSVDPKVIHGLYWSDYLKCQEAFASLSGFRK